jgi:hypothetical protein
MFGYFGSILSMSDTLSPGTPATFTFQKSGILGSLFFFDSDASILQGLQDRMGNYGNMVSVSRPLFSDRWVIVVTPAAQATLSDWLSAFDVSWRDMGYTVDFIQAEGGIVSTQPGGVSQILPSLGSVIGTTAQEIIKPVFTYVLIGVIVYAGIKTLPQMMSRRKV